MERQIDRRTKGQSQHCHEARNIKPSARINSGLNCSNIFIKKNPNTLDKSIKKNQQNINV